MGGQGEMRRGFLPDTLIRKLRGPAPTLRAADIAAYFVQRALILS
jgi:hypothetical protein